MIGVGIGIAFSQGTAAAAAGGGDVSLQQNVKVLFIGDSTTVGVGADPTGTTDVEGARPYSVPLQARDFIISAGYSAISDNFAGDNGVGLGDWTGYRPDVTIVGTPPASSRSPTAGGFLARQTTSTSIKLYTDSVVDTLEFTFERAPGFGVLGLKIDGVPHSEYATAAAPEDYHKVTVAGLAKARHQLEFYRVSGYPHGPGYVNAWDSSAVAFQIINAGTRDTSTAWWTNTTHPASPLGALAVIDADIGVIDLGINDWRSSGVSVAQVKANIQTIMDELVSSGASIVLVVPHDIGAYSSTPDVWSAAVVLNLYQELHAENAGSLLVNPPVEYFNAGLSAVNPATYAEMNSNGYMYDSLHCNAAPYAVEGQAVASAIVTLAQTNGWIS